MSYEVSSPLSPMNFVRTDAGAPLTLTLNPASGDGLNNQKMAEPDRSDGDKAANVGNPPEVDVELSLKTNI